ncbi:MULTISPECIES: hypothetical protein [unclassified Variovorax]|uniref:hypothetical protein n=1 Tax=unclassified Variovorax TaxID=663243 RepID=UPI002109D355|nr:MULTISPECIES: hypothetical protein [unclassified Variovorax]
MKKSSAIPKPLTPSQVKHVLELLDLCELVPIAAADKFQHRTGTFSVAQQEAIEILFSLEQDEIPDALFECVDDDARELVRDELPHMAQVRFVRARGLPR